MNRIRSLAAAIAALALASSPAAIAALTDISPTPLASSASNVVKPNLSFVLDTSGSMAWSHAPDEAEPWFDNVGYKTSQCNTIYYDPNIVYPPPRNSDGTSFPNATYTSAWRNGFNTGAGTVNLNTSFYAYDNTSSSGNGTDTAQPAYYYRYVGSQSGNGNLYLNTSSTFYQECNLPATNFPVATITVSGGAGNTSVTSITVNGVQILSAATAASTTSSTVATRIATNITLNGFSATVSGTTVTVTGPNSAAGQSMVITKTGSKTVTGTAFSPFVRVAVGPNSGPGNTDERQNFANWFSYYRFRMLLMKSGVSRAFVGVSSGYRVGFMTIYVTPTAAADPGYLQINDFTATQKSDWYGKLFAQNPGGNTPLKAALSRAGRNLAGKLGPDPLQYSCQQQFVLLTTDGYWNAGTPSGFQVDGSTAIANEDNNSGTAPRPLYDGGLAGSSGTLADVAMYYYKTDLRTAALGACNTGVAGADVCQNNVPVSGLDNAPYQHVTTFTLGLGVQGTINYSSDYLTGGSADFNAIVAGSKNWPSPTGDTLTTVDDLWHAAVNGRGQYFSAKNPDLLVSGLQSALSGISAREAAGAAAATSNLEPVAGDNFAYVANYRTQKWDGDVEARTIDLATGAISNTPVWSAQGQLDARTSAGGDTRNIFTYLGGAQVPFLPASFSAAQKAAWFTPANAPTLSQYPGYAVGQSANATADSIILYLRGQFGNERRGSNPANNQLYRVREHVLGDIVNGKPVYVKIPPFLYTENNYQNFKSGAASTRPGAVYVAVNDGMLHSFDSATGAENWAYIPSFVLPNLKALADDNYATNHRFSVDGSPTVSDVWTGSAWRTILVAGLNAGGRGYYALDVTNPTSPSVLWEFTDANMGFSYGNPLVGKLTDGTWVVMFTSGYNNPDGIGRLYVLDAYTGTVRFIMSTGVGTAITPSGLSKISGWVDDGLRDNTIQRVYGGDLYGNLWRFDVNDMLAPAGRDAFKLAFFQVGAYFQPITTKPELGLVKNKPVVFVGTGKYLGASDLIDLGQQSLYAIRDDLSGTAFGNIRSAACATGNIVQQSITIIDANNRSTSTNAVDFDTDCAWFVDFNPSNDTPGERVNVDPRLQLGVLAVATNIPEQSVCTVGGSSFLYFFDYTSGQFVSTVPGNVVGQRIGSSIAVGLNTYRLPDGRVVTTVTTSDDKHPVFGNPTNPLVGNTGKRVLWRELLQ